MIFAGMAPWQVLVWILGLELISAPVIIFVVNAITIGKYKAQEQHQARMIATLGKILEELGTKLDKFKEEIKNADETSD